MESRHSQRMPELPEASQWLRVGVRVRVRGGVRVRVGVRAFQRHHGGVGHADGGNLVRPGA